MPITTINVRMRPTPGRTLIGVTPFDGLSRFFFCLLKEPARVGSSSIDPASTNRRPRHRQIRDGMPRELYRLVDCRTLFVILLRFDHRVVQIPPAVLTTRKSAWLVFLMPLIDHISETVCVGVCAGIGIIVLIGFIA